MRKRIYRLLPDLAGARAALDELLLAGIPVRHMHFAAREGRDLTGLHAANLLQTSDVVRSAEAGLVIGAATGGMLGAMAAVGYPIVGDAPQWSLFAVLTGAGAVFGAWTSSMIGISTPSRRLRCFAQRIEQGQILLMVDVPPWRAEEIEARLLALEPEDRRRAGGPDIPAFP